MPAMNHGYDPLEVSVSSAMVWELVLQGPSTETKPLHGPTSAHEDRVYHGKAFTAQLADCGRVCFVTVVWWSLVHALYKSVIVILVVSLELFIMVPVPPRPAYCLHFIFL